MATAVYRVQVLITDIGECPMCNFDSLRRVAGYRITTAGVTTVFEQIFCGRCINDIKAIVDEA